MFEIKGKRVYYNGWSISPKRLKMIEISLIEGPLSVRDIAFKILSPQVQDVTNAINFLADERGPCVYYKPEYGRWAIIPEKVDELRQMVLEWKKLCRGEIYDRKNM